MSDTGVGTVNPNNSANPEGSVHNSLVLQEPTCVRPKLGGQAHQWTDLITAPSGRWYWPGSTVIENDTLLVFACSSVPGVGRPRSTSRSTAPPSPATTCPARIPGRHEPAGAECAAGHLQRWPDPVGHPLGARRRRQRVPLRDDEAVQPRPRGRVGRPGAVRAGHEPERVGYSTDVPAPLDWVTSSRWRSP